MQVTIVITFCNSKKRRQNCSQNCLCLLLSLTRSENWVMICVLNVVTQLISGLTNHQVTSKRQASHSSWKTQSTFYVLSHSTYSIWSTASLNTTVLQIESGMIARLSFLSWNRQHCMVMSHMSYMFYIDIHRGSVTENTTENMFRPSWNIHHGCISVHST